MVKCEILCRLDQSAHNFGSKIITSTFHSKSTVIATDCSARKTPNPFIHFLEVRSFSWSAPIYCLGEISLTEDNSDYFASAIIAIVSKLIEDCTSCCLFQYSTGGCWWEGRLSKGPANFPFLSLLLEKGTITLKCSPLLSQYLGGNWCQSLVKTNSVLIALCN